MKMEFFTNSMSRETLIIKFNNVFCGKSFSSLPHDFGVMPMVFRICKDLKVFNLIVKFVTVYMMNMLIFMKLSFKKFFYYVSMFRNLLFSIIYEFVSLLNPATFKIRIIRTSFVDTKPFSLAFGIAVVSLKLLKLRRWLSQGLFTMFTTCVDWHKSSLPCGDAYIKSGFEVPIVP